MLRVGEVQRHSFLSGELSESSVVLDLGMNRGEFSRAISDAFGCRIIGVEPVPDLYDALPQVPRVTAEPCAVNATGDPVTIHLNRGTCATTHVGLAQPDVETVEVPASTLSDLLSRYGIERVALVKLDVEGSELEILEAVDPQTLARIDQLTVEFHDFIDPSQAAAVDRVMHRLDREGFARFNFSRDNTDVLFVNRRHRSLDRVQRAWLAGRYKYPRGVVRRLAVRFGRSGVRTVL